MKLLNKILFLYRTNILLYFIIYMILVMFSFLFHSIWIKAELLILQIIYILIAFNSYFLTKDNIKETDNYFLSKFYNYKDVKVNIHYYDKNNKFSYSVDLDYFEYLNNRKCIIPYIIVKYEPYDVSFMDLYLKEKKKHLKASRKNKIKSII